MGNLGTSLNDSDEIKISKVFKEILALVLDREEKVMVDRVPLTRRLSKLLPNNVTGAKVSSFL